MIATTTLDELVAVTLQSPHPEWELRGIVRAVLSSGYDQEALIQDLNQSRRAFAANGQEREENALFDVLDALSGWSEPKLIPGDPQT